MLHMLLLKQVRKCGGFQFQQSSDIQKKTVSQPTPTNSLNGFEEYGFVIKKINNLPHAIKRFKNTFVSRNKNNN